MSGVEQLGVVPAMRRRRPCVGVTTPEGLGEVAAHYVPNAASNGAVWSHVLRSVVSEFFAADAKTETSTTIAKFRRTVLY